jgi:hypothetical protein
MSDRPDPIPTWWKLEDPPGAHRQIVNAQDLTWPENPWPSGPESIAPWLQGPYVQRVEKGFEPSGPLPAPYLHPHIEVVNPRGGGENWLLRWLDDGLQEGPALKAVDWPEGVESWTQEPLDVAFGVKEDPLTGVRLGPLWRRALARLLRRDAVRPWEAEGGDGWATPRGTTTMATRLQRLWCRTCDVEWTGSASCPFCVGPPMILVRFP